MQQRWRVETVDTCTSIEFQKSHMAEEKFHLCKIGLTSHMAEEKLHL